MSSKKWMGISVVGVLAMSGAAMGTPLLLPDGAQVGATGIIDFSTPIGTTRESLEFSEYNGGMNIMAAMTETSRFKGDGGLNLVGQPVRMLLGGTNGTIPVDDGVFEIWRVADATEGTTALPAFSLDTGLKTAVFRGVNTSIVKKGTDGGNLTVEGALTVGGKAVLTQGGAFGTSTASVSSAFAIGSNSTATGAYSFAGGTGSSAGAIGTFAWGAGASSSAINAISLGNAASATATDAMALGKSSTASGSGSVALAGGTTYGISSVAAAGAAVASERSFGSGVGLQSLSYSSAILGLYNTYVAGSSATWVNTDPLFTLGNGESDTARSTALATLKNGQTTLRNKYWNSGSPTAPVAAAGANDGKALVVEGNTELKGRVIVSERQGDVSMGDYAN